MDVIQNQCLRLCTGALKCTPIPALEVDCGVLPLNLRREMKMINCGLKYNSLDNNPAKGCFIEEQECDINNHFRPILSKIKDVLKSFPSPVIQSIVDEFPFWEYSTPVVDLSLKDVISKQNDNLSYTRWCLITVHTRLFILSLNAGLYDLIRSYTFI